MSNIVRCQQRAMFVLIFPHHLILKLPFNQMWYVTIYSSNSCPRGGTHCMQQ
jgi:hypothetical protein